MEKFACQQTGPCITHDGRNVYVSARLAAMRRATSAEQVFVIGNEGLVERGMPVRRRAEGETTARARARDGAACKSVNNANAGCFKAQLDSRARFTALCKVAEGKGSVVPWRAGAGVVIDAGRSAHKGAGNADFHAISSSAWRFATRILVRT